MKRVSDYSFTLNIKVLTMIGLYPSVSYRVFHKVYACVLYVIAVLPTAILGLLHFIFSEDLTDFKYNDFIMVAMIFYAFKWFPCLLKRKKIKHCIHYFDDIYYSEVKDKHKKILKECTAVCRRNTNIFLMGCVAAMIGFTGQFLMNMEELPLNVWLPKFVKKNALYYHIVQFLLVLAAFYAGLACGTIDPLIGGLCHHATAQIQILKENLKHLDRDVNEQFASLGNSSKSRKKFLLIIKCIQHHQAIQNFVREYQNCFSFVVFSQFAGSSLVIGMLCFQMSRANIDIRFFIMVNDLCVGFFQILFCCYYGTLLVEESQSVSDAIYMSRWYEYNIQCRKALIILMEYSKKPMVVTAGKMFHLSLETFTMILRRAYSLVAVLKNY